jgi:hypothetical protein
LVNFMRLSLEKAAYVAVNESSVVGNPEYAPAARRGRRDDKWRVVTFIRGCRIGWTEKQQQVPRLPPDFLSGLVVSVDFMRLSLKKAAYMAVDESSVVEIRSSLPRHAGAGGMTKWGFALPCNVVADGSVEPPQKKLLWTNLILSRPYGTDRDLADS